MCKNKNLNYVKNELRKHQNQVILDRKMLRAPREGKPAQK